MGCKDAQTENREKARIREVERLGWDDLEHSSYFTNVVRVAATLCDVQYSTVSIVGEDTVSFAGRSESDLQPIPSNAAFCGTVVRTEKPLLVLDAKADKRFEDLPCVRREDPIRFYLGIPLRTLSGHIIGSLCHLDPQPRTTPPSPQTMLALHGTANLIVRFLEAEVAEKRLKDYIDVATDWLWEQDADLRFTYFSSAVNTKVKMNAHKMIGKTRWEIFDIDPETDPAWQEHYNVLTDRKPFRDYRYTFVNENGEVVSNSISGTPVYAPDGSFAGYRGVGHEITKDEEARRHIEYLALHDSLTGLSNRTSFEQSLDDALETAEEDCSLTVYLVDLDRFKEVNDTLGHAAGDALLQHVAAQLREVFDPTCIVARLGGDEFAVLDKRSITIESARETAESLLNLVGNPFKWGSNQISCSLSIGIAQGPENGSTTSQLMSNVDLSLYRAKLDGKQCVRHFQPTMRSAVNQRRRTITELSTALRLSQFELFYQPIVHAQSHAIVGAEALLRWNHPSHGLLLPEDFLEIMESCPLATPISDWILEAACMQGEIWCNASPTFGRIAVNISPSQFTQRDFPTIVRHILDKTGLPASMLELEVTETMLLKEGIGVKRALMDVRSQGVTVAFDDFGTGYASLSHLQNFPIDRMKIDKEFVADIGEGGSGLVIAQAVTMLSKGLGLTVTAEGIENTDQAEYLAAIGCDELQGYYFARPMRASEFDVILDSAAAPCGARVADL
ncbi:MAG: EAL domain-containing protein [Stappiaceae bacterium]